jgi:RNA polymerase sigma-70 factor, ECF subfamily
MAALLSHAALMNDRELLAAYRETSDQAIFRTLVERHQDRVFRLIASVLGPGYAAEAEEVTQEVFLTVHQKLGTWREEAQFSTWLYRVAWNRAADHRRRQRLRRFFGGDHLLATLIDKSDPHAELAAEERRREVLKALDSLPDLYRTLVHLYYWMDCSLEEIAELTGVPPGTAKSYLARARKKLGVELGHE